MPKILHIVNSFDPACDVVRCVDELDRFSKHTHELLVKDEHPLNETYQYINAGLTNVSMTIAKELEEWADAVLYHFVGYEKGWGIKTDKPRAFRNINIYYNKETDKFWSSDYYNATDLGYYKLLGSSHIGAQDFLPGCRFLPDLIPIDKPLYTPNYKPKTPCVAFIKHWQELQELDLGQAVKLKQAGTPHLDVLFKRKTEATIVIDNVCDGHYGLAGLESLSLGLPTIAYNHPVTQRMLLEIGDGEKPPFINVETLEEAAQAARNSLYNTSELGLQSRAWMVKYHSSKRLIERYWDTFLDELIGE